MPTLFAGLENRDLPDERRRVVNRHAVRYEIDLGRRGHRLSETADRHVCGDIWSINLPYFVAIRRERGCCGSRGIDDAKFRGGPPLSSSAFALPDGALPARLARPLVWVFIVGEVSTTMTMRSFLPVKRCDFRSRQRHCDQQRDGDRNRCRNDLFAAFPRASATAVRRARGATASKTRSTLAGAAV